MMIPDKTRMTHARCDGLDSHRSAATLLEKSGVRPRYPFPFRRSRGPPFAG
jgi:hypothetical protein